ncbi:alpha-ketoglutarate-dependent dioxygenase AlkB [Pseudomonas sp. SL4(2022)]|uniref:alpha-ketoglutarate-dependent dioxygenase AlkB family protein n=1 Tax=Pseudomonas sp. SL4(2022) TaxID=2994661 RepID=UPI00226E519E|nr:alpha-ketoglutarate-dependent dioxygenase AlkB [Pseudomonas sp. SL4(2022)]WAC46578.1 alpha-ketoglutarate-dependent dioxygenase AlkB [Pseudomonas sp. SL4(2022)]
MDLFADSPLHLANADLQLHAQWLNAATADRWLAELTAQTPWQQPQVQLYGRQLPVPRLVAWYGDAEASYRYSGLTHQPLPWTPLLALIRAQVEQAVRQPLNGVLLNYYRDGQDSMGWHSDDEAELGANPLIASLNLGGTRRFDLRRKGQSRIEHSLPLQHGSLLVMRGPTQHYWQHQVAKTRSACAPRLNLTFRLIKPRP